MTSSTESEGTSSAPFGVSTWPIRLGPVPYKSSPSTLPPKPPISSIGLKLPQIKVPIHPPVAPNKSSLRKVSSVEKLNSNEIIPGGESGRIFPSKFRNYEDYDSKGFGSLDSLRDIVNGSKEDISPKSDGSDLVTSLTKALDRKLKKLRPKSESSSGGKKSTNEVVRRRNKNSSTSSNNHHAQVNGGTTAKHQSSTDNSHSKTTREYRHPSLHRYYERGNSWSAEAPNTNGHDESLNDDLTHTTCNNKSKKASEIKRRHSLSGTADILRAALEEQQQNLPNNLRKSQKDIYLSSDALATALTANNILESHV